MSKIPKHLIRKIDSMPAKPGIYKMKDINGNIIYIGKSKTLKSRVKSYFYGEHKWEKIKRMVFHIADIDFIVTDTHLEAQILECVLIKKLKPIYNAQFKNDKKYKYLKVEKFNRFKPLIIFDEKENESCFGPYRSKRILSNVISFFQNIYPIRKCGDKYEFTYNIIPINMDEASFIENSQCLLDIFSKQDCMLEFVTEIENKMKDAASEFQFEIASQYRDMQNYIEYLFNSNGKENESSGPRKVLMGEKIDNGYKVFYISDGNLILKKKYRKITNKDVKEFLKKAKKLEKNAYFNYNEKRALDFKQIINAEIEDAESKTILYMDNDYNIDDFIDSLTSVD